MAVNSANSTKIQTLSLKSSNSSMSSSFSVETLEDQTVAAGRGKPVELLGVGETGNVAAPEIERDDGEKAAETVEDGAAEGDEEEGECGFCLFMKGGGCRESFIAWEKCVEEAEKNKEDIVDKCFEITGMLKKCMDAHSDYYAPVLQAERALEEEAAKELERGAAVEEAENSADKEDFKDSKPDSGVRGSEKAVEKGTMDTTERGASVQEAENSADKKVTWDSKRDTGVHSSEKVAEKGTVDTLKGIVENLKGTVETLMGTVDTLKGSVDALERGGSGQKASPDS